MIPVLRSKCLKKLREVWSEVDTSGPFQFITIPDEDLHNELKNFYMNMLKRETRKKELLLRGNYQELAEISLILLGGQLPNSKVFH